MIDAQTPWGPEHFIGGHPALDLANAVFNRLAPADDNELLKSAQDLANWFRASGLADDRQARLIAECSNDELLEAAHAIREASFAIFNDIASSRNPMPEPLGFLMATAATGLKTGNIEMRGNRASIAQAEWQEPHAILSFMAMLPVNAYFTLPMERIRSWPRCGWLFIDTSKGGKRRWCSMRTCGNREKVTRHREQTVADSNGENSAAG